MDIRVPHLAEGIESGTVVNVFVSEGDVIRKDQNLLELETEKAVAAVPATAAGRVTRVHVKPGDAVNVGQILVSVAESREAGAPDAPPKAQSAYQSSHVDAEAEAPPVAQRQERAAQPKGAQAPASPGRTENGPSAQRPAPQAPQGIPPAASPTVRKVARDLGIELAAVKGSERGGRIIMEDLRAYVQRLQRTTSEPKSGGAPTQSSESPDFSRWGAVSKKPLSSLRRTIALRMSESWTTIPHVTQFDDADISALLALREKQEGAFKKAGTRLTLTAFALKVAAAALKKFPIFNSSLDEAAGELVFKDYVHIGVAVDTDQGLIVPVLRDVDKKSLLDLARELDALVEKTRSRRVAVDDLQGGSFTITNQGGIGGTYFTPIINKPQVAILGLGRAAATAGSGRRTGTMLPVCLSYDHRVIDGANAVRFSNEIVSLLEAAEPGVLGLSGPAPSGAKAKSKKGQS